MGSAAKVVLSPGADVDDLKKQVKTENADGLLKGISPAELIVYLNMIAYESRATVAHLEEDASVVELGNSKQNALVVLVPTIEAQGIGMIVTNSRRRKCNWLGRPYHQMFEKGFR